MQISGQLFEKSGNRKGKTHRWRSRCVWRSCARCGSRSGEPAPCSSPCWPACLSSCTSWQCCSGSPQNPSRAGSASGAGISAEVQNKNSSVVLPRYPPSPCSNCEVADTRNKGHVPLMEQDPNMRGFSVRVTGQKLVLAQPVRHFFYFHHWAKIHRSGSKHFVMSQRALPSLPC